MGGKGKRKKQISKYGKSPFLMRAVNINSWLRSTDSIVWKYLSNCGKEMQVATPKKKTTKKGVTGYGRAAGKKADSKKLRDKIEAVEVANTKANMVFLTESGIGLMYFQLKDFQPSVWMGDAIINCFATNHDVLCNTGYDDAGRLEKFSSALLMVLNKDTSLMGLSKYRVIVFPILENHHFFLVSFDMDNLAISVIDNMHVSESHVEFVNDTNFFKKTTPFKVKDIFTKYLKSVNHVKGDEFEGVIPKRLEIEWATKGNSVDCGVFGLAKQI